MAGRSAVFDDRGAVTSDWLVLTAGIVLFGTILTISVMENSGGYLMDELEMLNQRYAEDSTRLAELERSGTVEQTSSFENN